MAPPLGEKAILRASYASPAASEKFNRPISASLPAPTSPSVRDKTAYLSELRNSTKQLQVDINLFLTQKMEQDKAFGEQSVPQKTTVGRIAEADEENYGEGLEDEDFD